MRYGAITLRYSDDYGHASDADVMRCVARVIDYYAEYRAGILASVTSDAALYCCLTSSRAQRAMRASRPRLRRALERMPCRAAAPLRHAAFSPPFYTLLATLLLSPPMMFFDYADASLPDDVIRRRSSCLLRLMPLLLMMEDAAFAMMLITASL